MHVPRGHSQRLKVTCSGVVLPFHLVFLRQDLSLLPPGCVLDSELLLAGSPVSASPLTVGMLG